MNVSRRVSSSLLLLLVPVCVAAQTAIPPKAKQFVGNVTAEILNPIIALLFAISFVSFVYGVVVYIWNPDNEKVRSDGKRSMLWGVIGFFVMMSVFAIMRLIINSIGADQGLMNYV